MPEIRFFDDSPDAGDPACICSWCGELITEAQAPAIRLFVEGTGKEARFHQRCFLPTFGGPVMPPDAMPDSPDIDDHGPYCEVCGCELERELCSLCDGTGYRDDEELMEEDPLWYQPGDTEPCGECDGKGGWWHCPNAASHPEPVESEQGA